MSNRGSKKNPQPRDGVRPVDRRAAGLTADYLRKARNVDQQYCGTPPPPPAQPGGQEQPRAIGPVERRLLQFGEVRGWCFGAFGEASMEVHSLVQRMAESRLQMAETQPFHSGQRRVRKSLLARWHCQSESFCASGKFFAHIFKMGPKSSQSIA